MAKYVVSVNEVQTLILRHSTLLDNGSASSTMPTISYTQSKLIEISRSLEQVQNVMPSENPQ
jgi:hypothetical protein